MSLPKYKVGDVITTKERDDACIAKIVDITWGEEFKFWTYHIEYLYGTYPYFGDDHTNCISDRWIKGCYDPFLGNRTLMKFEL